MAYIQNLAYALLSRKFNEIYEKGMSFGIFYHSLNHLTAGALDLVMGRLSNKLRFD